MPREPSPSPRRRPRGRPSSLDRTAALDATWRVIARRGLDRTRYQDIADESGVAISTLQHAFGRLEQILQLALARAEELDERFFASIPAAGAATPWERIEHFLLGGLAYPAFPGDEEYLDGWLVWVEQWRAATRDAEAAAQLSRQYERWWTVAREIIEDGIRDGSFRTELSSGEAARVVNALLDGAATNLLLRHGGGSIDDARRVALLGARCVLGVDPEPPVQEPPNS